MNDECKKKFTPGPWKIQKSISGVHPIAAPGIRAHITYVNDVENAHLIATAPELYEAMEDLIGAVKNILKFPSHSIPIHALIDAMNAAGKAEIILEKARGEK